MISTLNFVDFTFINKYDSGIKLIQDLKLLIILNIKSRFNNQISRNWKY